MSSNSIRIHASQEARDISKRIIRELGPKFFNEEIFLADT